MFEKIILGSISFFGGFLAGIGSFIMFIKALMP